MFQAPSTATDDRAQHWSWSCAHENTEVRARTNRIGVVTHCKQCMSCGRFLGTVKRQGAAPPFDESLRERVRDDARAFYQRQFEQSASQRERLFEERRQQRQQEYWQYLASPQWRRKRNLVLHRCSGMCESCGLRTASEVHHLKYPKRFGDEPLWDLRGVCRSCHARIHGDDQ